MLAGRQPDHLVGGHAAQPYLCRCEQTRRTRAAPEEEPVVRSDLNRTNDMAFGLAFQTASLGALDPGRGGDYRSGYEAG
jgi:hypothetical protein